MLKLIDYDFYNITQRIKRFYKHYLIFFNSISKEFCVYSRRNRAKMVFEFSIGKKLDNRTLKKAVESSIKNCKKLFKDIQETNNRIEKNNFDKIVDYSKDELNVYLSYANKKSCDVDFSKINRFKWI